MNQRTWARIRGRSLMLFPVAPRAGRRWFGPRCPASAFWRLDQAIHHHLGGGNGGAVGTTGVEGVDVLRWAHNPGCGSDHRPDPGSLFAIEGPAARLPSPCRRRSARGRSAGSRTTVELSGSTPAKPGRQDAQPRGWGALIAEALPAGRRTNQAATLEIDPPSLPVTRGKPSSPPPRGSLSDRPG